MGHGQYEITFQPTAAPWRPPTAARSRKLFTREVAAQHG